jgi:hypothetical protein
MRVVMQVIRATAVNRSLTLSAESGSVQHVPVICDRQRSGDFAVSQAAVPSPACLLGGWIIDMTNGPAADAAIAFCRSTISAELEVRHSLWGVQVRTADKGAADLIARCYAEPEPVALAA